MRQYSIHLAGTPAASRSKGKRSADDSLSVVERLERGKLVDVLLEQVRQLHQDPSSVSRGDNVSPDGLHIASKTGARSVRAGYVSSAWHDWAESIPR